MGNSKNQDRARNKFKGKKIKRASTLNGKLGGRPKTNQIRYEVTSGADDYDSSSDEDWREPSTRVGQSTRVFGRNKRSMFFMSIEVLQCILNGTTCRDCKEGTIQVDITSYNIFNTHLLFQCDFCKKEKFQWSGPNNLNKAVFMAGKFTGIKKGQLGNFTKCLNFGFENQNGKQWAVNVREKHTIALNRELDVSLDQMKIENEKKILAEVQAIDDKSVIKLACDGYYPIRKNSGVCVSTAMVSINGTTKVLCKLTKGVF